MKMQKKTKIYSLLFICLVVVLVAIFIVKKNENKNIDIGKVSKSVSAQSGAIVTDKLIYFISPQTSHIMVYDKNTEKYSELCNKPECKHDGKECNSYVEDSITARSTLLHCKNHMFYLEVVENKVNIVKQTMDGSNREVLTTVYEFVDDESPSLRNADLKENGDYLFFVTDEIDPMSGLSEKSMIVKVDVESGEKTEIISEKGTNINISILQITDKKVDYIVQEFTEELDRIYSEIKSCDIEDGAETVLMERVDDLSGACIVGSKIYYKVMYENVYVYDIESKNTKCIIECVEDKDKLGKIYTDNKYIYIDNFTSSYIYDIAEEDICTKIYSLEGEYINEVKFMNSEETLEYNFVSEDRMLYFMFENSAVRYIETESITKDGEIKWGNLYEFEN